jgi:hypothetical protein
MTRPATFSQSFVRFMSRSHYNSINVELREGADGAATLRAVNVVNCHSIGGLAFPSVAAAEEWYEQIPGTGAGKMLNAVDRMTGRA